MIKAFNRWDVSGIKILDEGLKNTINIEPKIVPKTGARYAGNRFHKSRTFIVERLMNKIMVAGHKGKKHFKSSGRTTGKANMAYDIIENAFKKIEAQTKENPIKVLVRAVENAAPREEVVSIEYGGARYPKAVDCSPQRRVDIALRHMTQGAYHRAFNSKKPYVTALTEEILAAYKLSPNSNAIAKKQELERQADASR